VQAAAAAPLQHRRSIEAATPVRVEFTCPSKMSEPFLSHQKCKGMRDLLPEDMLRFRRVEQAFLDACELYGYEEVKPPTIEYLQLFTALGTLSPGMVSRVYSFLDWDGWSGERVVLRPDSTIPVARLYVENLAPAPARLSYVTNSFVFEATGTRNRERWQCGAEFIGGARVVSDVEILLLARDIIDRLGLEGVRLQLFHAGIIKAVIEELDLAHEQKEHLIESVLDGDWRGLADAVQAVSDVKRYLPPLLTLSGTSAGYLENVRALAANAGSGFLSALDEAVEVARALDDLSCPYEIDITAVRSFEYYTGICFQFLSADGEKIGGGGRYDDLIPMMGGPDLPSCGFALYIDQIAAILDKGASRPAGTVVVSGDNHEGTVRRCLALAQSIRARGGAAVVRSGAGPVPAGCRWVVEVQPGDSDAVVVTDCDTSQSLTCSIAEALTRLVS
jgi:histidyl-tRNA synthetase